jgi:hypothetical protein
VPLQAWSPRVVTVVTSRPRERHHTDRPRRASAGDKEKTSMADETYKGEFYCVKCKAKREAEGKVVVSENGRRMAKGVCPVCGTNLNRILGKA